MWPSRPPQKTPHCRKKSRNSAKRSAATSIATSSSTIPTISDAEFDRLVNELKAARGGASGADHAGLADAARGRRRRARVSRRAQHRPPMLSLDNAFSYEELDKFDRRVRELTGREARRIHRRAQIRWAEHRVARTRVARSCAASRAAMAPPAKTSPRNVRTIRSIPVASGFGGVQAAGARRRFRGTRRNRHAAQGVRGDESPAGRAGREAFRESAQCGGRRGARADPSITASRRLDFFGYYLLAGGRYPMPRHSESLEAISRLDFKASEDWKLCRSIDEVKKYCDAVGHANAKRCL